jgi:DNA mismatch repair protein MutS
MSDALTPMMQQYRRIKAQMASDVILFFRLGDFYEMFAEDALAAAPILDITLTRRHDVPMCGVPYHAVDLYLSRLIRAGRKVAICDQMEDPSAAKGIVRRDVTRIVTPGAIMEDRILDSDQHNFLAGIHPVNGGYGVALLDISTGLFEGEACMTEEALRRVLHGTRPAECLVPAACKDDPALLAALSAVDGMHLTTCDEWFFAYDAAYDTLIRHFNVHSLEGFGCERNIAVVGAAGAVLHYVRDDLRQQVGHVGNFRLRHSGDYMLLDETTSGNLDLVPQRGREGGVSLFKVLDVTRTAMGRRKLRDWILQPLASSAAINRRLDAVEAFSRDRACLHRLSEALGRVRDLERLIARLGSGGANARDLAGLGASLQGLPEIKEILSLLPVALLQELDRSITPLPDLTALIQRAIVDEPPLAVKEGGLIRPGYRREVDDLRQAASEGHKWLAEYQAAEQARTGIKTLKVRYNKVFGYYIEVSKGQLTHVPAEYIRKQTIVNGERYITPELKEYESRILGAQERAMALEYEVFVEVRNAAVAETRAVQATADAIAGLDVLAAFADRALALRYIRPVMTEKDGISITDGRHPIVEQLVAGERFVPNDSLLNNELDQIILITGPNMAGKSTYIRQVALIVIMAQMGAFVPAAAAEIGIVDRVFTRVGASDDLARGRSTFLVEMQETANILNNATARSLIVLDEIGRGTSTFDGISIAWAVAEYLHNSVAVKAKTLFATHYHELTDLALTLRGVKNYNVLVRESADKIVFLRKIVPGAADKSYGIQVARLAGLPADVIDRAKEILVNLEEGEISEAGLPKLAKHRGRKARGDQSQLPLFE